MKRYFSFTGWILGYFTGIFLACAIQTSNILYWIIVIIGISLGVINIKIHQKNK